MAEAQLEIVKFISKFSSHSVVDREFSRFEIEFLKPKLLQLSRQLLPNGMISFETHQLPKDQNRFKLESVVFCVGEKAKVFQAKYYKLVDSIQKYQFPNATWKAFGVTSEQLEKDYEIKVFSIGKNPQESVFEVVGFREDLRSSNIEKLWNVTNNINNNNQQNNKAIASSTAATKMIRLSPVLGVYVKTHLQTQINEFAKQKLVSIKTSKNNISISGSVPSIVEECEIRLRKKVFEETKLLNLVMFVNDQRIVSMMEPYFSSLFQGLRVVVTRCKQKQQQQKEKILLTQKSRQ